MWFVTAAYQCVLTRREIMKLSGVCLSTIIIEVVVTGGRERYNVLFVPPSPLRTVHASFFNATECVRPSRRVEL